MRPPLPADTGEGARLLVQAESELTACRWSAAANSADRAAIAGVPERARVLSRRARDIDELFRRFDEKDELTRAWDTDPRLVSFTHNGQVSRGIPVRAGTSTPVEGDPRAAIAAMSRAGQVTVLLKSVNDYIYSELGPVDEVASVDQAAVRAEKIAELDRRLAAVRAGDASDAVAWYDLARFAWRNRLDGRVAPALDQAFALDPELAASVREERAARLFAAMTFHLKNRSLTQADAFMGQIRKRYADTGQGRQAQIYYDEERNGRAHATPRPTPIGDPAPARPAAPAANATAAQQAFDEGMAAMRAADALGPVPGRNHAYARGEAAMAEAQSAYRALFEATGDPEMQRRMEEAGRMKFWCHKGQTL